MSLGQLVPSKQGESGILLRDIRSEIEGSQEALINNTTNQPRLPYITVKVPLDYRSRWPREFHGGGS